MDGLRVVVAQVVLVATPSPMLRDGLMMMLSVLLGLAGMSLLVLAGGWIWSLIVRFWSF
jgi:hypothetical protein